MAIKAAELSVVIGADTNEAVKGLPDCITEAIIFLGSLL
jgi:hypothetical protein